MPEKSFLESKSCIVVNIQRKVAVVFTKAIHSAWYKGLIPVVTAARSIHDFRAGPSKDEAPVDRWSCTG